MERFEREQTRVLELDDLEKMPLMSIAEAQ